MTLPEVAERARVKISTLRAWRLNHRNLPFVKLAGKVLVRRKDLEAFIEAGVDRPRSCKTVAKPDRSTGSQDRILGSSSPAEDAL
jgi:hypothetical protein